jgi:hypothetical protein
MKSSSLILWSAFAVIGLSSVQAAEPPDAIRKALAAHDRAVHAHDTWVRDPYVVLGPDGWFYYTGTTQRPGTPTDEASKFNTGLGPKSLVGWHVAVWRSADLIKWESLGTPYTIKDSVWFQSDRARFDQTPEEQWRVWAPELHWTGQRWALIHTIPQPLAPKVGASLVLSGDQNVSGPWTSPLGTSIGRRHDPSMFRDDDGTWWMIWGATEIAPLKTDFSGFAAEPTRIGPSGEQARMGHEGCLIMKIEGRYVLFGTGWSTGKMRKGSYNLYYATADRITGPYSERKFVGRFLGHGTPFYDKQGRWWCTGFFNGDVPPLDGAGIEQRDLAATAQTINQQGLTLVPLDVRVVDGELIIRAKDPRYATPGPDEAQSFQLTPLPPLATTRRPAQKFTADPALAAPVARRWSVERAQTWMARQPRLLGANFLPSTAINQIEMWQASTFDLPTIERELGWAAAAGVNTMRVFLHDLVWADDAAGLYARMDQFLAVCAKLGIRPMFVFFDDCHHPDPALGVQPLPVPAFHNSGWMNSPARELALRYAEGRATTEEVARLRGYVQETMRHFARDERVLMWELYNEPGRGRGALAGQSGGGMLDRSAQLLRDAWTWARAVSEVTQPICSTGLGSNGPLNIAIGDANSDVLSFHSYAPPEKFEQELVALKAAQPGRPIVCTEFMARTAGNTFEACLPILKKHGVGAICWGLVAGKSATIWPWDSRAGKNVDALRARGYVVRPGDTLPEPELWFHDVFRADGTPYRAEEIAAMRAFVQP